MSGATDGFEDDIKTLYRYKIDKVELPVRRVKDLIDTIEVFTKRLRDLCPIEEDDEVVIVTSEGEKHGHVTGILISCTDGRADIATDVYDEYIDSEDFDRRECRWYVEVE